MKLLKLTVWIAGLSATTSLAASDNSAVPIEPLLVPVSNEDQSINIQMGQYEVTVAEFTRFVNATGYKDPKQCRIFTSTQFPDLENPDSWDNEELVSNPYRPVVCVSTYGAIAYADWLTKTTGKPYRLPTKTEWLYAASAGTTSRFAFGEDLDQTQVCDYENIEDFAGVAGVKRDHNIRYETSANCNDGAIYHTVVGMYRPNQFGLYDMIGNVKELLQSCLVPDETDRSACAAFDLAGESWHWQARPVGTADSLPGDFYGSMEGFRLVLDSVDANAETQETLDFAEKLSQAQKAEQVVHQRIKSIPISPENLTSSTTEDGNALLNWNSVAGANTTYTIYRSYVDAEGLISREPQKIAVGLTTPTFTDELPGEGAASYRVFATNPVGESMASNETSVGSYPVFRLGDRIQAEYYASKRHIWFSKDGDAQVIGFISDGPHYFTGDRPFIPAKLRFNFVSDYEGKANLRIRFQSDKNARFEIWQGNHMVSRISGNENNEFREVIVPASLVTGDMPLELRASGKDWFQIDWFEINRYE